MTAYVIAQISIHDRPRYERYVAGFMPTLQPFRGRIAATPAREPRPGATGKLDSFVARQHTVLQIDDSLEG